MAAMEDEVSQRKGAIAIIINMGPQRLMHEYAAGEKIKNIDLR